MLTLQGLDVDSATLWEQLEKLARLLESPYEALRTHVLSHELVHVEELRWSTPGKSAKAWWIWSIASHDAIYYQLAPVRGYAVLGEMLGGFSRTLMFDDAGVYEAAKAHLPGVTCVLSWANVRASFDRAGAEQPEARRALELLDELFDIERDQPAWQAILDEQRRTIALEYIRDVRRERCAPVCDALLAWANAARPQGGSLLHVAIERLLQQWTSLTQFLERPELPLSAAAAPQKGHQGSKSLRGSEVSALFYTLVESAKLASVEPSKYLCAAAEAALAQEQGTPLLPRQLRASRRPAAFF
jgi:transposase